MQLDKCYKHPVIHVLCYIINWSSVVINPIIYVVSQKKYQDALKYTKNAILDICRRGPDEVRGKQGCGGISLNFEVWLWKICFGSNISPFWHRMSQGIRVGAGVTPSFESLGEEAHPLF